MNVVWSTLIGLIQVFRLSVACERSSPARRWTLSARTGAIRAPTPHRSDPVEQWWEWNFNASVANDVIVLYVIELDLPPLVISSSSNACYNPTCHKRLVLSEEPTISLCGTNAPEYPVVLAGSEVNDSNCDLPSGHNIVRTNTTNGRYSIRFYKTGRDEDGFQLNYTIIGCDASEGNDGSFADKQRRDDNIWLYVFLLENVILLIVLVLVVWMCRRRELGHVRKTSTDASDDFLVRYHSDPRASEASARTRSTVTSVTHSGDHEMSDAPRETVATVTHRDQTTAGRSRASVPTVRFPASGPAVSRASLPFVMRHEDHVTRDGSRKNSEPANRRNWNFAPPRSPTLELGEDNLYATVFEESEGEGDQGGKNKRVPVGGASDGDAMYATVARDHDDNKVTVRRKSKGDVHVVRR